MATMSDLLLKTKLSTPLIRTGLVARPRLVDKLNSNLLQGHSFARKLTLVSAPAGFGKTTLVADWLKGLGQRAAWLSLDEGDNDPARFLAYLLAALQQIDSNVGVAARSMLQSLQPPPGEAVLNAVINDLAEITQPFSIVLDDYHAIQNPSIHRLAGYFLEHQPEQVHLVILTREDPLLPVSRLRSRDQVCEIRQEDLRFTLVETAGFIHKIMGFDLAEEDLDTLQDRTEGWIAGLQLAALSLQASPDPHQFVTSFAGSQRYILDYLFEEIFSQQAADTQDFLLKTSILDRLSAALCDAVAGRSDSRERLEALERANLFIIPLDPGRDWYRYHHLFRELLHHQLHIQGSMPEAPLHQRACQWYAAEGFLPEAIQHGLAAQDWASAARLIGQASDGMLKRGEIATLVGWYKKLPKEVVYSQPALCMGFAWALLLASDFEGAEPLLEHAEKVAPLESVFLGQVAAAQAYLARARDENQQLIEKSQQALALLPQAEMVSRGNVALNLGLAYWHTGRLEEAEPVLLEAQDISRQVGNTYALLAAQIFLARTAATRGRLRQAADRYQRILQEGGRIPILALAHYDLSMIYYEWNQLPAAAEHLQHGLEMSTRSGNVEFQNSGQIQRVYLALAQGDPAGAVEAAEQSHMLARDFSASTRARSAACHVHLAMALEDLELAEFWARQAGDHVNAHSFYRFFGLSRPRLLIARGQKQAAAEILSGCYETAFRAGWGYVLIAVRVLQTLAAGTPDTALEFLADALQLGQPEGFIRTFADVGEPLVPHLQEAALRGIQPEYVGQLLSAMRRERAKVTPAQSSLVEPLSERELDVLRLVTAGLSNREIAAKLVVSPGTAKTHIHNICGKLGVRNRTEAAIRAKELNLV